MTGVVVRPLSPDPEAVAVATLARARSQRGCTRLPRRADCSSAHRPQPVARAERAATEEEQACAAQSWARRGDEQHALEPQHVWYPGSVGVHQATCEDCAACRRSRGTARCALWGHRERMAHGIRRTWTASLDPSS